MLHRREAKDNHMILIYRFLFQTEVGFHKFQLNVLETQVQEIEIF